MCNDGDASQESMFTVGSWVVAGNINLQIGGYPQNNQIFEYLQVASTGAGQVCFNTNTVNNYSAAYPAYGLNSPPAQVVIVVVLVADLQHYGVYIVGGILIIRFLA